MAHPSKEQTVSLSIHPLKTSRPPFSIATSRETDAFLAGQLFSSYKHLENARNDYLGKQPLFNDLSAKTLTRSLYHPNARE